MNHHHMDPQRDMIERMMMAMMGEAAMTMFGQGTADSGDDDDNDNSRPRRRATTNARRGQRVVHHHDNDDDDDDDDEEEEESFQQDGFEEDQDMEINEDNEEQEDNNKLEYSGGAFVDMCLRIARNDDTLIHLDEWYNPKERLEVPAFTWQIADLILLGKSLCGNDHLQSLTVAMNPHCLCHQPQAEHAADAVQQGMAQSKQLHSLTLIHVCGMILSSFLQGLVQSSTLQRLEIRETLICDLRPLAQLLMDMPTCCAIPSTSPSSPSRSFVPLTHLTLNSCKLDNLDILPLALSLGNNTCLLSLNLSNNLISNVGIYYLCQHWKDDDDSSSPLQELDLSWNNIGPSGALALLDTIQRHCSMRKLLLTGNAHIGHAGLALMGPELADMRLQQLNIAKCNHLPEISSVSPDSLQTARALALGLRNNTSLVELNLGSNNLGPQGIKVLMQAVTMHPTLQVLVLAFDATIGVQGLQYIGNMLGQTKLKRLCVDGAICPWQLHQPKRMRKAGHALLQGVMANVHLTDFSAFGLNSKWMKPIQWYVDLNRTCRPLLCDTPSAVWPHAMAKLYAQDKTSHLYFVLREQPWLVCGSSCSGGEH